MNATSRTAITVADQGLSSAQNFALVILTARVVFFSQFGAFTVGYALALLLVTGIEALVTEPFLLTLASSTGSDRVAGLRVMYAILIPAALVPAIGCIVCAQMLPSVLRYDIETVGLFIPVVVLQDAMRFAAMTVLRPVILFLIDLSWIVGWIFLLIVVAPKSGPSVLAVWLGSSALGAIVGIVALRPKPCSPLRAWGLWRQDYIKVGKSLFAEWSVMGGSAQLITFALSGLIGLRPTGGIRAAQSLLGPLNTLTNAARIAVTPEVIRVGGSVSFRGRRILFCTTFVLTLVGVAVGGVAMELPAPVGEFLYGRNWGDIKLVLLPIVLSRAIGCLGIWPLLSLRADNRLRALAAGRTAAATSLIVFALGGAVLEGTLGAAWGLCLGAGTSTVAYFVGASRRNKEPLPLRPSTDLRHAEPQEAGS